MISQVTISCRQIKYCVLGVLVLLSLWYYYVNQKMFIHVPQNFKIPLHNEHSKNVTVPASAAKKKTSPSCVGCHTNPLCKHEDKLVVFAKMFAGAIWKFYLYGEEAKNCTMPNNITCLFTDNSSYYPGADVLFINECKRPQTQPAYPQQLILRYNHEAEWKDCNSPSNIKLADARISYTLSSTISYPYLCRSDVKEQLLEAFKLKPPSDRNGIAMFVSSCHTGYSQWRYKYLKELMEHIHIDSHGDCMHNTNITSSRHLSSSLATIYAIKVNFIKTSRYKFLISFENSISPEYVTEKLWHAYLSQSIPIYYGAPEVYNQVPGNNTFIDATKFSGPKDLADYIRKVDQNDVLYQSYFNFNINVTINYQKNYPPRPLGCAICNHMYQLKQHRCKA